ncbi:cytochrome c maturation protein CcmE [Pseudenhygromyxa sp. WMMC2535]|uniref:cytochrome c maturation protein CcmE n=1 Tax=Pseudenhygromyxa sp. WMMC2535 TaxID=2712867 RepID=UPI001555B134|nr:cytochrome c maturation protein CcmE [Pseudenhygromyxa sp. WMMC2535]NVB36515.1 cytochrome c maturation protein CcmE [Pseudenhygromyxa sp. WMMC2535]
MALSKTTQFAIGGVVLTAVAFLVLSSPEEGVLEYVYVDKVVASPGDYDGREFKVHGNVVEDSLRQAENGDYLFVIEYKGERLKVVYDDLLPDTFMEGGEVVLTGNLDEDGTTLRSSEMTAKCPSKYEEEPGAPAKT